MQCRGSPRGGTENTGFGSRAGMPCLHPALPRGAGSKPSPPGRAARGNAPPQTPHRPPRPGASLPRQVWMGKLRHRGSDGKAQQHQRGGRWGGKKKANTTQNQSKRRQLVTCTDGKERSDSASKGSGRGAGKEACREHPTPPAHHAAAAKNRPRVGHCHLYKKCNFPSSREGWLLRSGRHRDPLPGTATPCPAPLQSP